MGRRSDGNTNTNTVHYGVKYQIYLKVTCIDVAVMFQQMHPGGKIKRNEVRERDLLKTFLVTFHFFQDLLKTCLVIFHLQVLRFVSALSKLKAKGRDWKSTLLSEVATITIIWPPSYPHLHILSRLHSHTLGFDLDSHLDSHIQGAWKVESERGSEASLSTNGDEHPTSKNPPNKEAQTPTANGIKSPKKGGAAAKKTQQRTKQSQKI